MKSSTYILPLSHGNYDLKFVVNCIKGEAEVGYVVCS
jgi:hypothetical protein